MRSNQDSATRFAVDQIDHVEMFVPNRREAAEWYCDLLGMEVVEGLEKWSDDPNGPLMIGTQSSNTKIALFEGTPQGKGPLTGIHLVAFKVDAPNFRRFIEDLPKNQLRDENDQLVTKADVADHGVAYSIYFCDPYGNHLEITSYDYRDSVIRSE